MLCLTNLIMMMDQMITSDGKVRFRTSVRSRTGPVRTSNLGLGSGFDPNWTIGSVHGLASL
jgi:hypothetical protein